jgi:hypothetical protein
MRDVGLQGVGSAVGRLAVPQELEEPVGRYHLVGVDDQRGQQQPRLAGGQVDWVACRHDLQRAENPYLHDWPLICSSSPQAPFQSGWDTQLRADANSPQGNSTRRKGRQ